MYLQRCLTKYQRLVVISVSFHEISFQIGARNSLDMAECVYSAARCLFEVFGYSEPYTLERNKLDCNQLQYHNYSISLVPS